MLHSGGSNPYCHDSDQLCTRNRCDRTLPGVKLGRVMSHGVRLTLRSAGTARISSIDAPSTAKYGGRMRRDRRLAKSPRPPLAPVPPWRSTGSIRQ